MRNLVLWSGGFDSSYLITKIIDEKLIYDDTINLLDLTIGWCGGIAKQKRELSARDILYKKFKEAYPSVNFTRTKLIIDAHHNNNGAELSTRCRPGLYQPMTWALCLIPFMESNTNIYTGYLLSDQNTSYEFIDQRIIDLACEYTSIKNVKINYALRWYKKSDILYDLMRKSAHSTKEYNIYKDILDYATACESSIGIDWCGTCTPCQTFKHAILELIFDAERGANSLKPDDIIEYAKSKFNLDVNETESLKNSIIFLQSSVIKDSIQEDSDSESKNDDTQSYENTNRN